MRSRPTPWASTPPSYKITSFCIAAFIAGVAGGLYAHVLSFIQPDSFSFTKSSDFLVYLYAGGSGSLTGSVIGARSADHPARGAPLPRGLAPGAVRS